MSSKNKLQRFAENEQFDNLFQYSYDRLNADSFPHKGKWASFFQKDHPLVLELGCGKGEYTVGLAARYPDKNFIGVDIKGARIWRGLKNAEEKSLRNVAFVRTRIELIEHFFDADEVSEIWITFPDPQPQKSRERKRLTSDRFLNRYRKLLKRGGLIHLKTDSQLLYDYTLETLNRLSHQVHYYSDDLYGNSEELEVKSIRTFYEQMWLSQGLTIKYIRFSLND